MNILHLDSSPLGGHSVTRELTAAIVAQLRRDNPGSRTVRRDLAADPLPHWAPAADAATPAARTGGEVLDEFLAADVVVIGAPMYNFSVPSQLKAWIDRIVIAGSTFRYTATGPEGLAGGRRVIVASARGGFYGAGTPGAAADFQEPYLRQVFAMIGIGDVQFVRAEGVGISAEQKAASLAAAHAAIDTRQAVAA
ncbi:FMN-dependent NADH-azoreductase [Chiayiivirga flava]|uniref:FMN dependent NADH:quinone oxidoreductase n=1 Tax=Chiayiivirga flava TaxID=659595 RepID=A0A7W8G1Y9_9GAMM|nr:NAD(P)H-dependent oxidoreductase [Chiayiivirga flava]MBB5209393.1 FMN-dependent NADH-azoreductase [Chiayiivirga flava]